MDVRFNVNQNAGPEILRIAKNTPQVNIKGSCHKKFPFSKSISIIYSLKWTAPMVCLCNLCFSRFVTDQKQRSI